MKLAEIMVGKDSLVRLLVFPFQIRIPRTGCHRSFSLVQSLFLQWDRGRCLAVIRKVKEQGAAAE